VADAETGVVKAAGADAEAGTTAEAGTAADAEAGTAADVEATVADDVNAVEGDAVAEGDWMLPTLMLSRLFKRHTRSSKSQGGVISTNTSVF